MLRDREQIEMAHRKIGADCSNGAKQPVTNQAEAATL